MTSSTPTRKVVLAITTYKNESTWEREGIRDTDIDMEAVLSVGHA